MKLNKIKAIFPAIALFLTASMTSCIDVYKRQDPTRPIMSEDEQFKNWGGYWQWTKNTSEYDPTFPFADVYKRQTVGSIFPFSRSSIQEVMLAVRKRAMAGNIAFILFSFIIVLSY